MSGLCHIHVFMVWVECVKALLVNVCYGTAKSADTVSRDMWVSTGQHADCACLYFREYPPAVAFWHNLLIVLRGIPPYIPV